MQAYFNTFFIFIRECGNSKVLVFGKIIIITKFHGDDSVILYIFSRASRARLGGTGVTAGPSATAK